MSRREAREAYDAIERVVRAADKVVRDAAKQVLDLIERYGNDQLSPQDAAAMMRDIEGIVFQAFGGPGVPLEQSRLYQAIRHESERVFLAQYRNGLDDLDAIMARYPWWEEQKRIWLTAPLSAVQADRLATAYRLLFGPHVDRQRLLNAMLFDPQRRWIDPNGYNLSGRIWRQGNQYRTAINRILQDGIRRGESADRIAARLRQYVDPAYAPVRYQKNGRIYRVRGVPQQPNAASAARRLARTEITRVHGESTKERARDVPGVKGIKWNLSLSHPKDDDCNPNADRDLYGLGAGVYPIDDVPMHPTHPNCLCYLTAVMLPRDETRKLIVDKYRSEAFEEVGFSPERGWAS
jgi:hypothetical protein